MEKSTTKENKDKNEFASHERLKANCEVEATEKIFFNGVEISKLTKSQMKKYKRMLKWEQTKKEKRAKERLKTKKRKYAAKLNNKDIGPSRKQLKRSTMANSPCKTSVVIDLSFDDLMISKDMGKVIKQILRVYTENRRSKTPMQLYLTNFEGRSKEEMAKHNGYQHWDMHFRSESYLDIFPKDKLVYLTSESENVINELDQEKVYIIGGLVDHNSHKGLCYRKALEQGISHGQLPIRDYFSMKFRKCKAMLVELGSTIFTDNNIIQSIENLVEYWEEVINTDRDEGKSFKEAFELVLPKRINMKPKRTVDEDNSEQDEESVSNTELDEDSMHNTEQDDDSMCNEKSIKDSKQCVNTTVP